MMAQLLWALALGITRDSYEALPFSLGCGHGSPSILKECQFQKGISHCVHRGIFVEYPKTEVYTVTLALPRLVSKT